LSIVHIVGFFYLIVISSLLQLTIWTMVGMGAFWLEQTQGVSRLFAFIKEILSGALIPLHLLPSVIQQIVQYLPFPYFIYIPLQVLMGKINGHEILMHCIWSSVWLIVLLAMASILWKKGLKQYTSPL
jgi:ABC-2 type transport system permease protein